MSNPVNSLVEDLLASRSSNPVRTFIESQAAITRLTSHFRRTSNPAMGRFVTRLGSLLESYAANPSDAAGALVESVATDCRRLFELSQSGRRQEFAVALSEASHRVREADGVLNSLGPFGTGLSGTLTEECRFEDEHKSFARAFDKKFKVKHVNAEYVSEGLYLHYDREDTATLLAVEYFDLVAFVFEQEYLLLRRGSLDDLEFGSFGEDASKWGFVYSPKDGSKVDAPLED